MPSLLRLSAAALMGLGFIVAPPAQAQLVKAGWGPSPAYYGYAPPPPAYYAPPRPRFYAPPVYFAPPPPVYFAPRPRFYGPPPWAFRHHGYRRW